MRFDLLYSEYPMLENEGVVLKKISEGDIDDFFMIHSREEVYKFIPGKARKNIKTVKNMIGHYERDFNKKKMVFLGVYIREFEEKLVGLAEIFDINKTADMVTIGYRINPEYWGRGIATITTRILVNYLFDDIEVNRIQAFVIPENSKSAEVLKRNSFIYEGTIRQGQFWKDKGLVDLQVYSLLRGDIC